MEIADKLENRSRFKQIIRFAPITLLILSSFFMRGMTMEETLNIPINVSSSYISTFAAFIILLSMFFKLAGEGEQGLNIQRWPVYNFLVFFILFSLFGNMLFGSPKKALRFTIELFFSIGLLFIVYLYIKDLDAVSIIYKIIMVVGGVVALYILIVFLPQREHIYRLTKMKYLEHLTPGGSNHSAHALAIATIISLVAFYYNRKKVHLLILALLLPTVILTGTRSASLGLAVSISIFILLIPKTHKLQIVLILCLLILLPLAYLGIDKIRPNLSRYELDFIAVGLGNRQGNISHAIKQSLESPGMIFLLFGAGMHRYPRIAGQGTIALWPHNIFIGMLVFVGFPAMLLLVIKLFTLFKKLVCLSLIVRGSADVNSKFVINSALFSLLIATIYSCVSGRLTRILTIWIIMGLAERVIDIYDELC